MFISCPNCATRYSVTAAQLGPEGKSVRCSNCGHQWHQVPVADAPPPAQPMHAAPPQPAPPQQAYAPPPGYPPYPPYPPPYPPPGYAPPPGYPPPGYPEPPAAAPEPAPEPEPVVEDVEDEPDLPDIEDDVFEELEDDTDVIDEEEEEDAPLSQDDLDAMFGDDASEPTPIESLTDDKGVEEEEIDADALEGLEEPEPIPQVFTAEETGDDDDEDDDDYDEDEDEEEGRPLLKMIIVAVVAVLLLGGIGGGLFFFKDSIPGVGSLLSMVGLDSEPGLSIKDVNSTREAIEGKDVLVVRGIVANIAEELEPVPSLEVRLYDVDGNVVQRGNTTPLRTELPAGEEVEFRIEVVEPSPLARRLEVTFVERDAAPDGN